MNENLDKREKFNPDNFELVPDYEYRNTAPPGCYPFYEKVKFYRLKYRDSNGDLVAVKTHD